MSKEIMNNYSVLMSLYSGDNAIFAKMAIDSILNQTLRSNNIVIVLDGPLSDELQKLVDYYTIRYEEIFILKLEKNKGLGNALALGLNKCKNEYIARMDADDISYPNRCEIQLEYMLKNPNIAVLGGNMDEFIDDPLKPYSTKKVPTTFKEIYSYGRRRNPFNHPTVMLKKSKIIKYGNYSNMRKSQDFELFSRILYKGGYAENLNKSLILFRANHNMFKRRKQKDVIHSYIEILKKSYKERYSSWVDITLMRAILLLFYITPISLLKIAYKLTLRSKFEDCS